MTTTERFFRLGRNIAEIEFNKSFAGCYRHGDAEYDAVGVLLLTWANDDMHCREKEVNPLEQVFKDKFNYHTEQYLIPAEESEDSLKIRLEAFIRCYDNPSTLGIIYYGKFSRRNLPGHVLNLSGGHAARVDIADGIGCDLKLFARSGAKLTKTNTSLSDVSNSSFSLSRKNTTLSDIPETSVNLSRTNTSISDIPDASPVDVKRMPTFDNPTEEPLSPDEPSISFRNICEQLQSAETDMLLIIDSCFAAGAFTDQPFGGRKCELLCSIAEQDLARAPGQPGSFTTILTKSLIEMIAESPDGFSTQELYGRIYRKQHRARKPFHFNKSRLDYGKIWLRPCPQKDTNLAGTDGDLDSKYTIDVQFHLTKSLQMTEWNRVVKALQWIPFVQRIKLQSMHSPEDDLSEFIRMVHLANRLRPLLARIRHRRDYRLAKQLKRTDTSPPASPTANTTSEQFLEKEPRNIGLFDWSKAIAVTPQKERLSPGEYFDLKIQQPEMNGQQEQPEALEEPKMPQTELNGQQEQLETAHKKRLSPEEDFGLKISQPKVNGQQDQPETLEEPKISQPEMNGQQEQPENPEELKMADTALQVSDREVHADAAVKHVGSSSQCSTNRSLSQRTRDGLLFFALGLMAPTMMSWAVQGLASPFAAS